MKALILITAAILVWVVTFFVRNIIRYNRLRMVYYNKFKFYMMHGYVNESYCNIYMEMFNKFRFHMFIKYTFYGYTSISDLTDNKSLYENYKISRYNKKKQKIDIKEMNEIFVYWRDQTL